MKKRYIFLSALALILSACGGNGGGNTPTPPTPGDNKEEKKFNSLVSAIKTNHNYTLNIHSQFYEVESELEIFDYSRYAIADKAWYTDYSEYGFAYTGIIAQKDQGYVYFDMPYNTIVPDGFASTNTSKGLSELVGVIGENLFIDEYKQDEANKTIFTSTGLDNRTVAAYMTQYYQYIGYTFEVGDSIIATLDMQTEEINLFMEYTLYYYDITEKADKGYITINVSDIGRTANDTISNYIKNPSTTFAPRNAWTEDDELLFDLRYNGTYPVFPKGTTYALEVTEELFEGFYRVCAADYNSGDLRSSYGDQLTKDGYIKKSANSYTKTVLDEASGKTTSYDVVMTYDEGDEIFPNGVFACYFRSSTTTSSFTSISDFNNYMTRNNYDGIIPLLPEEDSCTGIANFKDQTDGENYCIAFNKSDWMKIYIPTYQKAAAFISNYENALMAKGFDEPSKGFWTTLTYDSGSVSYGSQVCFENIDQATYASKPYVSLRVLIAKADEDSLRTRGAKLASIAISDYKTEYELCSKFAFDGKVTATYENGATRVVKPTSVSSPDMSTVGNKEVTVSYTEGDITKTAKYTIAVIDDKQLAKIEIGGQFQRQFVSGSAFNHTGLALKATFSDGSVAYVGNDATYTGFDSSKLGVQTITISYTYKSTTLTATYDVLVSSKLTFPALTVSNPNGYDYWFMTPGEDDTEVFNYNNYSYVYFCVASLDASPITSISVNGDPNAKVTYVTDYYGYSEYKIEPTLNLTATEITITINGSSPSKTAYILTKQSGLEGGIINIINYASGGEVDVGSEVKFTAKPSDGYTLDKVYIVDHPEIDIGSEVGMLGTIAYKFNMPAFDCTIGADFTNEGPSVVSHLLSVAAVTGGTINLINHTKDSQVEEGSEVTFSVIPSTGYSLKRAFIIGHSEVSINSRLESGKTVYYFVMPAYDVVISAEFESEEFTISKEVGAGGSVLLGATSARAGVQVEFFVTPSSGYEIKSMSVKNHPEIVIYKGTVAITGKTVYYFTMIAEDVTVEVTFQEERSEPDYRKILASHGIFELYCEEDETKLNNITFYEDGTAVQKCDNAFSPSVYTFNYELTLKEGNTYIISFSNVVKTSGMNGRNRIEYCTSFEVTFNSGLDRVTSMEMVITNPTYGDFVYILK